MKEKMCSGGDYRDTIVFMWAIWERAGDIESKMRGVPWKNADAGMTVVKRTFRIIHQPK